MAAYNKFNQFSQDVLSAKHDFASHVFKVMLTNTAPAATNQIKTDITELGAGNGYTAGGTATTITVNRTSGVTKVSGTDVVFTATGPLGPFRYAVLYNDTQATPAKPLVAWWDYGSAATLSATETFTVDFDATNGIFDLS